MQPKFNAAALKTRLSGMPFIGQLIFGALCCERLLPNFLQFAQDESSLGVPLRAALDVAWSIAEGQAADTDDTRAKSAACEASAPSSDESDSLLVTAAQDACFAICSLLDYALKLDTNDIVEVARFATDSIDLFVQEVNSLHPQDPQLEQKILNDPLMQRELVQQDLDLEQLVRVLDPATVRTTRLARSPSPGNLSVVAT
jgi:uncharacterized protein YjaG (DUF416 family)